MILHQLLTQLFSSYPNMGKLDLLISVMAFVIGIASASLLVRVRGYLDQGKGLPTISSFIEYFESSYRQKLPHIPYIVPVRDYTIEKPWDKYAKSHSDLFACPQLSTPSYAVYVTSNPQATLILSNQAGIFGKPVEMFRYAAISIFGKQITSTQNGEEHRRHKRIVEPCLNEGIMQAGWEKMVEAYDTMKVGERIEDGGIMEDVKDCMIKLTLYVFGRSGSNFEFPWNIPKTKSGDEMPIAEALHTVENSMIAQLLVPLWLLRYFPLSSVRRLGQAQVSFVSLLRKLYRSKRLELDQSSEHDSSAPPKDILGALVASQMSAEREERLKAGEKGTRIVGLMESEIIGNIWIFLLAGHETTGHTLTFLQAFLAVYPEWQDKLYKEIKGICGDETPGYRQLNQLHLCLAACYETIRLKDIVMTLPKIALKDAILPYTTWDNQGNVTYKTHVIKKGSHIIIDSPALSLDPFVWNDPEKFDPTRFLDENERASSLINNFAGFSLGQRQCIGKRFAEVEMVAYIAHSIYEYRLYPVSKEGESEEEMRGRILRGTEELTLTPFRFGIRYEKR
ncbi:hypothetical protein I302_102455 [Kwoniella bestiolae CBS 10118]|uniref:Cytochrome P450 n=1 Tax=Kwoniella bestiolae CBS 10118 TaxID=1296100 RepID=A0A1B9GF55_9TREE|nr:hypothetical protein I302_01145 [Kwoniella bestiolae CBS 10118]OCF29636.1 hypothetical protein I302_01145 [Kwoniella bestiolae CBS 10118]